MAHARDHLVHFVARQLAAFARLGALGDLDLQIVGIDEIVCGDAEAGGRDLLDGAAAQVTVGVGLEARFVFAAFAGVGLSLDAIHGDGERFVRFLADRAEGHGAGGKALHDFGGGLDVVERHRRAGGLEIEHAAQHQQIAILLVDDLGEFLEGLETRLPHGVLELAHRRRDSAGGARRAPDTDIRRRREARCRIRWAIPSRTDASSALRVRALRCPRLRCAKPCQ